MATGLQKNMPKIPRLIVCLGALLLCVCVEIPEYAVVDLKASPPEGGTVSSSPSGPEYNIGMVVTFTAVAKQGYVFKRWEGWFSDTLHTVTKTITGDKYNDTAATAYFAKVYTLRVYTTPGGIVTASPPDTTIKNGTFIYETGTRVRLEAAADSGYRFYRWSEASSSTDPVITLTMGRDTSLAANFVKVYKLTVNANPEESGTVAITPTPNSDSTYDAGQPVNVEAVPNPGYRFDRWSGDTASTAAAIRLSMDRRWNVTANFEKVYKLSAVVSPAGGGTVTLSPPPPRDSSYDAGTPVTALATPRSGYRFDGWAGDTASNNAEIRLTMNRSWNIVAKFVKVYKLSIIGMTANGDTLWVRDSLYDEGARVPVTAPAVGNYRFERWYGALTGNEGTIIMDANKLAIATYVRLFRLTVINSPTTGGTITTVPAGPVYDSGTVVNVTATSKAGYRFSKWSGASTSTNSAISITMNGNKDLTAIYEPVKYQINVSTVDGGMVEIKVNGISYADRTIDSGAVVTVTATAKGSNDGFDRWTGVPTGATVNSNEISFTMTGPVPSLTAIFVKVYKLTVTVYPQGWGDVDVIPPSSKYGVYTYTSGTQISVTAMEFPGYTFKAWTGALESSKKYGIITMNADKTLIAEFVVELQPPE